MGSRSVITINAGDLLITSAGKKVRKLQEGGYVLILNVAISSLVRAVLVREGVGRQCIELGKREVGKQCFSRGLGNLEDCNHCSGASYKSCESQQCTTISCTKFGINTEVML